MFERGSCLSEQKKCEFTSRSTAFTENYQWLRSLTADRTYDIADSFSHALGSDADWWVDKVFCFLFFCFFVFSDITRYSYQRMRQNTVLEWPCMILSGVRRVLIGNTIVSCLQSSYRANKMSICIDVYFRLVFTSDGVGVRQVFFAGCRLQVAGWNLIITGKPLALKNN